MGEIEVERWVNRDNRKENLRIGKRNYRYVGKNGTLNQNI